jgi:hypothetical protein
MTTDKVFAQAVATTVCNVMKCNVMVKAYVPDTELILAVARNEVPTYQIIRTPLAPGMAPDEIMEAVVQQVMVALPLKNDSLERNVRVRTCEHEWTRSNLGSGPDGYVAQCAKCLRMADYLTSSATFELWGPALNH